MISVLSKDINNIVNKYLDYSFNNFISIFNQNKVSKYELIDPNITMEDIMIKCVRTGNAGFYTSNGSCIKELNAQLELKLEESNIKEFIIKNIHEGRISFKLKNINTICHISWLNILKLIN